MCGVFHANELKFVFGNDIVGKVLPHPRDAEMTAAVQLYWATMAKTGDPNSAAAPAHWPRYNASTDQHLLLQLPVQAPLPPHRPAHINPPRPAPADTARAGTDRAPSACAGWVRLRQGRLRLLGLASRPRSSNRRVTRQATTSAAPLARSLPEHGGGRTGVPPTTLHA